MPPLNLILAYKIYMNAGPYFAYGIAGKINIGGESQPIKFGSGTIFEIQPFDAGINFGFAINIKKILLLLIMNYH